MFKPNVYILLAYDVFEPHFGKVIDLLSTDIGVFIVYHECMTHCFDSHYHAYIFKHTSMSHCVSKISTLPYFLVFHSRRSFSQNDSYMYIHFKFYIEN